MQPFIIDPITSAIISGLIVAIVGGLIMAWVRRRWNNKDHEQFDKKQELLAKEAEISKRLEAISNIEKSIWRLNKTILIMAKIIDEQTEKSHSELNSSLEDIATELLTDTKS